MSEPVSWLDRFEYSKFPNQVLLNTNLSVTARLLYVYMNARAGKRGWFFPSGGQAEIATDLGVSVSTVRRCIRDLEGAGVLEFGRTTHYGAIKYIVKTAVKLTCVPQEQA